MLHSCLATSRSEWAGIAGMNFPLAEHDIVLPSLLQTAETKA